MDLFDYAEQLDFGNLHICVEPDIGLEAIVAIHDLTLGPAIGGCRFIEYGNSDLALEDAMRLGRGMTYKAAITGLPHGGGKAVIKRPPSLDEKQREQLFTRYGQFIEELNGQYITCEDSGTRVSDMNLVRDQTDHVLGFGESEGGSGDPSPVTAFGCRRGIEAAIHHRYGSDEAIDGKTVAIQGVGSVGYYLGRQLHQRGADLIVTDIDDEAIERSVNEFGARAVSTDDIYGVDCDIFAPCALGGVLNDETIPELNCDIIAGSANNQLESRKHDKVLADRGILYAPDYAINAGGLINVAEEYAGYDEDAAMEKASAIYDTMAQIFDRSETENRPTGEIADEIARERIEAGHPN